MFEKNGSAANTQVQNATGKGAVGGDTSRVISNVLKGAGHMHWVGSVLYVIGIVADRWQKARTFPSQVLKYMIKLIELGEQLLRLPVGAQNDVIQDAISLVHTHAENCRKLFGGKLVKRFLFADIDLETLKEMTDELMAMYSKLTLDQICPAHAWSHGFPTTDLEATGMVGLQERVEAVLREVEKCEPKTSFVAMIISGIWGIGKSTLGQHVAATLAAGEKFSYLRHNRCKINFSDARDPRWLLTQMELLFSCISGMFVSFQNQKFGFQELEALMGEKQTQPCLIYLDNVEEKEDLARLLPLDRLAAGLHPESILIVTTVNESLLSDLESKRITCLPYRVENLSKQDATMLWMKSIFQGCDPSSNFPLKLELMLSTDFKRLMELCDGVPVAIEAAGSYIYTRGRNYLRLHTSLHGISFEEAHDRLDLNHQPEFLETLKRAARHSFNSLSDCDPPTSAHDEKLHKCFSQAQKWLQKNRSVRKAFVEISSRFAGQPWAEVESVYAGDELAILEQMSLLKRVEHKNAHGKSEEIVQVNGLLKGLSNKLRQGEMHEVGTSYLVHPHYYFYICTHGLLVALLLWQHKFHGRMRHLGVCT